jgi:hypothetical protein
VAASFLIEEPVITGETLSPVLCYLEDSTDLADKPKLSTQLGFVASFDQFLRDGGDLADLIVAFEDRVLTRTDPNTHVFDVQRFSLDQNHSQGRTSPARQVHDLIAQRDAWDLVALVCELDQRYWQGWTATRVIAELHRVTGLLLQGADKGSEPHRHVAGTQPAIADEKERVTLLWAALVLVWEARLVSAARSEAIGSRWGANVLFAALDQLGRAFLDRAAWARKADLLEGLWPELQAALSQVARCECDRLSGARVKTLRGLVQRLASVDPDQGLTWLTRLRKVTTAALEQTDLGTVRQQEEEVDRERRVDEADEDNEA